MARAWGLLLAIGVLLPTWLSSTKVSSLIEKISDPKDLKKLLRTRNNVLVLYSKSEAAAESHLKLLSTVAQAVKGQGTICWVDCGDAESRKLCKKMKVDLSPKDKKIELFHYQDGAFHMEYDRAVTLKSIVAFLKDPKGPPLWEEDPGAKDVVHIDSEKDLRRLLKKEEKPLLMMFYAPWCSMCKRVMPHFQKAATQVRGHIVLAGMNVYPSEFESIREEYNVRGYPTICYFEKGRFLFQYENYGATAEDIVEWLKNPQPPQPQVPETPWADEGGSVYHLTDEDFDQFVKAHSSVLVMFHAPCKTVADCPLLGNPVLFYLRRPEEDVESPDTGVTGGCEPLCGAGTKPGSSARTAGVLHHSVMSQPLPLAFTVFKSAWNRNGLFVNMCIN